VQFEGSSSSGGVDGVQEPSQARRLVGPRGRVGTVGPRGIQV
jgi:hypothetical protein